MGKALATVRPKDAPFVDWGIKNQTSMRESTAVLGLIIGCPTLILVNWIALEQYGGSLTATIRAAFAQGPAPFLIRNLPRPTMAAFAGYIAWLLLQTLLYEILPGAKAYGQRTPGGMKYIEKGLEQC